MLKVLIADDHDLFLTGLQMTLSDLDDNIRIESAADHRELLAKADGKTPWDLILTDLAMPGMPWHESLRLLREANPETPIVVLSAVSDHDNVTKAIDLGASGFIPKTSPSKLIISALRLVLAGGLYLPSELLATPSDKESAGENNGILTPRQLDVLKLIAQGKPNKIIANELHLSEGTVKLHVTAILKALNVINRTGAVSAARNMGLIEK